MWRKGTIYGREKDGSYKYRCKCGDHFLRDGKRFMQVLDNGKLRPYKLYEQGKWVNDEPDENAQAESRSPIGNK